uniref:Uncharacterized protein n=1 Tax=mine drainage metagenome TaxID=410659 RepID=E6PZG5_9ZZZZ
MRSSNPVPQDDPEDGLPTIAGNRARQLLPLLHPAEDLQPNRLWPQMRRRVIRRTLRQALRQTLH